MLRLYNTLTKKKEAFAPQSPDQVTLYTCGPTVYDYAHIGNLRTFIFEDVLKRTLRANDFDVAHVMNITDVGHLTDDGDLGEDKMEKGATREGRTVWDIAQEYTDAFIADCKKLNIVLPSEKNMPRATAYIAEQIAMIETLEQKEFTYTTADGVYFDTSRLSDYGKLARLDIAGLQEGARVEKNTEKKHPTDFALWKFSPKEKQRAMEWNAPWGKGFPGWHIECSAMIEALLGKTIDIHCGGIDHIPVHHTNEIAQSEAAHDGAPLARMWMHGEFLLMNEGKMSKSDGTFVRLQDILDRGIDPLAYRLFVLSAHYRSKLNFTDAALIAEGQRYTKIIRTAFGWEKSNGDIDSALYTKFLDAINDDLNTSIALAIVEELLQSSLPTATKAATLYKMDEILGLDIEKTIQHIHEQVRHAPIAVKNLIDAREAAREAKNYTLADEIREKIIAQGFDIEDRKNATPLLIPIQK